MKFSNVMLETATKIIIFIVLTFSTYLFFAGHHNPGGGFIGGLVMTAAIVLFYMTFDVVTAREVIPVNFRKIGAFGALIAVTTGVGSFLFDVPFLTQSFTYVDLPLFGETELATSLLFDVGVFLAVIGSVMTIILSISEDV
ncbi:Na(+)/H(+) antiporter subunit B [Aliibacillus thermotolerans]|uniref:Na(+)/H(+) antiporter subunit B n=1 Tax=Aliibacillus thermotolerans TaxID=1834418 RepID=A0ABW0UA33_9BACI|nr:Na(+)/H(+) antiporter subunit B [Aliibacillus thermotolerans]MDA3131080.1 Na(+)/H(+) antiporter subunit B [Aliibacillus thermotolerans]